ncbi:MAG TPA: hypothetical protein VGJ12_11555 [Gemmatimonadaceae bacterium]|jgi:hypothetical protein
MHTASRVVLVAGLLTISACSRAAPPSSARRTSSDSSFAAMQDRGKMAMGVDQSTSTHTFDALPNGGRIELVRDLNDSLGIAQIRAHLHLIQHAFQAGDFSTPQFVHMQTMPGTAEMAKKRDVIAYSYHDLPRGGEVVMTTSDAEALAAIHAFMGAQRTEHHAMGTGSPSSP